MKGLILSMMMLSAFFFSTPLNAEPYAKKIQATSSTSQMSRIMFDAITIPDSSDVEIPAYPGALIFMTKAPYQVEVNGEMVMALSYIKLLSTDPLDKVLEWYKQQLTDYNLEEAFGMGWVLWKGGEQDKFNTMDMTDRMTIQNVSLGKAIKAFGYDEDMKGASTVIEIYYK